MRGTIGLRRVALLAILLAASGAAASLTISRLEERDTFCITCHTQPEVAYQQRALQTAQGMAPALDLSSRHYQQDAGAFRCIDCHRGNDTLPHRLLANALAARDTVTWIMGGADATLEKGEVSVRLLVDGACVRCHGESLQRPGFENHFHSYLPAAEALLEGGAEAVLPSDLDPADTPPQRSDALATTVTCMDCHQAHVQVPGAELQGFLDLVNQVFPACEICHLESGFGPQQLSSRGS